MVQELSSWQCGDVSVACEAVVLNLAGQLLDWMTSW